MLDHCHHLSRWYWNVDEINAPNGNWPFARSAGLGDPPWPSPSVCFKSREAPPRDGGQPVPCQIFFLQLDREAEKLTIRKIFANFRT